MIKRATLEIGPWHATYRLCTHGGQWRWFRSRGRSELDDRGRIRMSGMVGDVHQQVLDRHELERHRHHLSQLVAERTERLDAALAEAERQREEAERARRAQSEFLAHMSHELRTPLHGLIGLTTLALDVAASPSQRRYLGVALDSGRTLLQLIETLLDFSRIDTAGWNSPKTLSTCPNCWRRACVRWRPTLPRCRSRCVSTGSARAVTLFAATRPGCARW